MLTGRWYLCKVIMSLNYIFHHLAYLQQNYFYSIELSHHTKSYICLIIYSQSFICSFTHSFPLLSCSLESIYTHTDERYSIYSMDERIMRRQPCFQESQSLMKVIKLALLIIQCREWALLMEGKTQLEFKGGREHFCLGKSGKTMEDT